MEIRITNLIKFNNLIEGLNSTLYLLIQSRKIISLIKYFFIYKFFHPNMESYIYTTLFPNKSIREKKREKGY